MDMSQIGFSSEKALPDDYGCLCKHGVDHQVTTVDEVLCLLLSLTRIEIHALYRSPVLSIFLLLSVVNVLCRLCQHILIHFADALIFILASLQYGRTDEHFLHGPAISIRSLVVSGYARYNMET